MPSVCPIILGPCCEPHLRESLEGKGARDNTVKNSSVARCTERMKAVWYAGCVCLFRSAPVPLCCPSRAVVATSLEVTGAEGSVLLLSAAQPAASATAGTPRWPAIRQGVLQGPLRLLLVRSVGSTCRQVTSRSLHILNRPHQSKRTNSSTFSCLWQSRLPRHTPQLLTLAVLPGAIALVFCIPNKQATLKRNCFDTFSRRFSRSLSRKRAVSGRVDFSM